MTFLSLGLSAPILDAVTEQGYTKPSPIQEKAIPAVIKGRDVMAAAQTGTGKTAGFTLPILHRLSTGQSAQAKQVRALILTPTRELAAQIGENVIAYGKNLRLSSAVVFGGVNIRPQISKLNRGVDILIATPGRLLDLFHQHAVSFKQLQVLVLDEADRMLDMGFIHDIRRILKVLPRERQNLLFSATFSKSIKDLAKGLINNPVEISVTPPNSTVKAVEQWIHPVDKRKKSLLLAQLIDEYQWQQVLVFSRTKHGANKLAAFLEGRGIQAAAIHGNKSQGARTKALSQFKSGEIRILVATDIAARGLDIDLLPYVVNFDLPNVPEDYVHRIGRTGRAGASGQAVSLVSADEAICLFDIEKLIKKTLTRRVVDGFEPAHDLPVSRDAMPSVKKASALSRPFKKTNSKGGKNNFRKSSRSSSSRSQSSSRSRGRV